MKKVLAIVLVLVLALSFSACGVLGALGGGSNPNAEKIIGKWQADVDMSSFFLEAFSEEEAVYFQNVKFIVPMAFEFGDDGVMSLGIDNEQLLVNMEDVKAEIMVSFENYIKAMMAEEGIEMEIDEFLELADMDLDAVVDELVDEVVDELGSEDMNMSYNYMVEGDQLYSCETDYEVTTSSEALGIEFPDNDTLKFILSDDFDSETAEIFEMIGELKRVK